VLGALTAAAGCGGVTSSANTADRQFQASLDPRQVVSPAGPPTSNVPAGLNSASGMFTGVLDTRSKRLSWHLTYTGLGRPAVAIADIHYGKRGQFGALLVRLCGPCRSSSPSGVAQVPPARVPALESGASWVTLITESYPNGAIRGQVTPR
jgi:hypothetical protein